MGRTDCGMRDLNEKTVNTKVVFTGKVFNAVVRDVELSDGSEAVREVVIHTGGACILPVDNELNCYLVRQFRSGAEEVLLEVPAGKIEKGEDPLHCALREIVEETGFEAGKTESLGFIYPTPAYCSERIHLYIGTDLKYVGSSPDAGEFLGVEKVPLSELIEMCNNGEIRDGKTLACINRAAWRYLR